MNKNDIQKLIKKWQQILHLQQWKVKIDWEQCDDDVCAKVLIDDDYHKVTMCLNPKWREWEPVQAEQTIVHELLHVAMRDIDWVAHDMAYCTIGGAHGQAQARQYDHEKETLVETLAWVLVKLEGKE